MTLVLVATPATEEQLQLFAERPRRDAAAAERAFARLAAEFGEDAVVVARLAEGHLPETQFVWETAVRLVPARPAIVEGRPLVRRILARPVPVVPPDRRDPDGWMPLGPGAGPVVRLSGPYRVATRWWMADEVVRESCFAETSRGTGLWLFCDAVSKTWLIHGRTE
jgi:hypothetical protein